MNILESKISLNKENCQKLKRLGYTEESFNIVIDRVLEHVEAKEEK